MSLTFKDEPSTKALEEYVAKITGKDEAMFCATGTMSNQIGLRLHLRGALQSVLLDSRSHIYKYENAGIAYHSQAGFTPVNPFPSRYLTRSLIEDRLIEPDVHCAHTEVVSLENTLNGSVLPIDELSEISKFARERGLKMHLDGARLWNASVATGIRLSEYCKHFDTVSLCLSKGIGAPIGSILVGSKDDMKLARSFRKLFGGGWRQSGPLAAAALDALKTNFNAQDPRKSFMADDHSNAAWLAAELSKIRGIDIVNNPVETNMLFIDVRNMALNGLLTVERLCHIIKGQMYHLFENNQTDAEIILPQWGYSFDDGTGSKKNDPYVMRLVLHHQIPRVACELLVEHFKLASASQHLR
jgi:threonine aldolase